MKDERWERGRKTCQTVGRTRGRKKLMQTPTDGERARLTVSRFCSSRVRARARWPAMSKKLSRGDALDDISTWNTEEVLSLLRKVSEVRRGRAADFALFEAARIEGRPGTGTTSRRTPTVRKARRDRGQRQGAPRLVRKRMREKESETKCACARQRRCVQAVNTRVFIARLIEGEDRDVALRKRRGWPRQDSRTIFRRSS